MSKREIYLGIILAVLLLVGLYVWYGTGTKEATPATEGETTVAASEARLERLKRLNGLQLDTAVLSDPRFKALRPREELVTPTPVPDLPPGRPNPFLPF